jgi:hypothetical protein
VLQADIHVRKEWLMMTVNGYRFRSSFIMGKKRTVSSSEDNPTLEKDEKEDDDDDEVQSVSSIADPSESAEKVVTPSERKKKPMPGVLYLSRIPNKMNVTIIRSYFDQYGRTGRIYLQLTSK